MTICYRHTASARHLLKHHLFLHVLLPTLQTEHTNTKHHRLCNVPWKRQTHCPCAVHNDIRFFNYKTLYNYYINNQCFSNKKIVWFFFGKMWKVVWKIRMRITYTFVKILRSKRCASDVKLMEWGQSGGVPRATEQPRHFCLKLLQKPDLYNFHKKPDYPPIYVHYTDIFRDPKCCFLPTLSQTRFYCTFWTLLK